MRILPSKLSIPQLPGYILERDRLFETINQNRQINCFISQAPAGYGKTILAIQYLNKFVGKNRQFWVDLDRYDISSQQLLAYIISSLSDKNRVIRESRLIEGLTSSSPIEAVDNLCLLFQNYVNDVHWLILDNWEAVDSPENAGIIFRLIQHTNDKLKIIINSRIKPSFRLQKLKEKSTLLVLDKSDLQLTFTEFVEAIKIRTDITIEENELERLWKLTSGWCINLGNIVSSLEKGNRISNSVSIEDYINEELFSNIDKDTLDKLLMYSILEVISPETCRVLTKNESEIDKFLKTLGKLSIPLYEMTERNHFRLHPMVKEAAQNYLLRKYDDAYVNGLYRRIASYYREKKNLVFAIEALIIIKDYEQILDILDKDWNDIVQLNLPAYIKKWLDSFSEKYHSNPVFIKTKSNYLTLIGDNRQMLEYLSDKIDYSKYPKGDENLSSLWMNYHWALINSSESPQYNTVLKSYKMLIKSSGPFSDISMAIFENVLSVAAHLELNYTAAIKHLGKCMEYLPGKYKNNQIIAMQNLGLYKFQLGDSAEGLKIIEKSIRLAKSEKILASLPSGSIVSASIYLAMGRFNKAIEMVETCIMQMKEYGIYNLGTQMYAERFKGEALWYLGEKKRGIKLIEDSMKASEYHNKVSLITIKKLLEFYSFHSGLTVKMVDSAEASVLDHNNEARPIHLADKIIRQLKNNEAGAIELLDDLEDLVTRKKLDPWKTTASFLKSVYFHNSKNYSESKKYLARGLNLLSKLKWNSYPMACEYINSLVYFLAIMHNIHIGIAEKLISGEFRFDPSPVLIELLKKNKLDDNAFVRLYRSLTKLNIRGFVTSAASLMKSGNKMLANVSSRYITQIKKLPLPPLKIYMIGRFEVYTGGFKSEFRRKKSKQILQYLLLAPNFTAHEEQLIEQFWPDTSPSKGKASLRTAIKDLRKSLDPYYEPRQKSYISYDDQHYKIILPDNSFYDLRQFEDVLSKYRNLKQASKLETGEINNIYKAICLYRGMVLPEELYESYTIEIREYIRNLYQASLLIYIKLLFKESRNAEILQRLKDALKEDPFWRVGIEMMIKIHVRDGNLFKAIQTYKEYEEKLANELGIEPDANLTKYIQGII